MMVLTLTKSVPSISQIPQSLGESQSDAETGVSCSLYDREGDTALR